MKVATLEQIAQWASVLTGEDRFDENEYYYVTEPVKRLMWKLTHLHSQLIAFTGLQGTGKTSALKYIFNELNKDRKGDEVPVILIKVTKDWKESLKQACLYFVMKEVVDAEDHRKKIERESLYFVEKQTKAEKKRGEEEFIEYLIYDFIDHTNTTFIDLPDYSKTDRRVMARNLSDIELLWEKTGQTRNIVVAMQKELFKGHFFLGKMTVIELKPLKPEELLHVFKKQFPDCDLITDKAVIMLGQLARGVFRRFLKYLSLTIENFLISKEKLPIDADYVNKIVTVEHIVADMELELYELFKNAEQRRKASELLYNLSDGKRVNQKDIAEFLDISMPNVSRLVTKLGRYVNKKRGKGREWLVSLKLN